jgi:large subunit ribosomal protein L30
MATAKKTLKVMQTGSENRKKPGMRETLRGLGLGRIHSTRELEDTPAVRGMLIKVRHLVRVIEEGK